MVTAIIHPAVPIIPQELNMKLQERLNKHREAFEKKAPPEVLVVMHRAAADLEASGMVAKALKVGDTMPPFTLNNQHGAAVSSDNALAKGPLVLGFYRGRW
jgi:ribosome-binding ATPase YchF (GTP1/OBG family)